MPGFGGAIKLTGESAYKKALSQITQNLKEVASEMKVVSSSYDRNDKSIAALTARQDVLTRKLTEQKNRLDTLKAQYAAMNGEYTKNAQKHQQLVDSYNKEKSKLAELGRTVGETSKEYQDQKAKVEELAQAVKKSTDAQNANEKSMSKMRVEINNAQADCNATAKELDNLGREAEEAGDGFTVFKGVLANLAADVIERVISGLKRLADSVINVGKQAYGSYAEYEQLVGGVETLFGDSADKLKAYASQAYATAGLSANKYMEQATSFAATLVQGLGGDTAAAADFANMAITDMSDNVNKMGTDMSSVQHAYQGFAKDTYTMLDNLKLGYGGTQGEMARLINDSGVLGDAVKVTAETVKDVPFDKIIEAIHVIQQQIGITGTTTLEAEKTITGSTAAMKAAWENLLVGIADPNQDITPLLDVLTKQVITAGENALPRIKEIVKGMIDAVKSIWNEIIPEIAKEFPELAPITNALKWITDNASVIISTLAGIASGFAAFKIVGTVTKLIGGVKKLFGALSAGKGILAALGTAFSTNPIGLVIAGIAALVTAFITLWNTSEKFRNFWIGLWDGVKGAFETAWNGITTFFTDTIPNAFNSVVETLRNVKDSVVEFFSGLPEAAANVVNGIIKWFEELPYKLGFIIGQALGHIIQFGIDAWNWVTTKVPEIINGIVQWFAQLPGNIWTWLLDTIGKIGQWAADTKQKAIEAGTNFLNSVVSFIQQLPGRLWQFLLDSIAKVQQFGSEAKTKAAQAAKGIFNAVINGIKNLPSQVLSIGRDVVRGIWNGINDQIGWIVGKLKGFGKGIVDGLKSALGIASPSKVFADEVGKWAARGVGVGFEDEMKKVSAEMQNSIPTQFDVSTRVSTAGDVARQNVFNFGNIVINGANKTTREMAVELQRMVEQTVSAYA